MSNEEVSRGVASGPGQAGVAPDSAAPALARTLLITAIMAASTLISLDGAIANVALPNIQASVGARHDEIAWVLTAYIVAVALATPLTGWLAGRLGRKRSLALSIAGFTVASMLCGTADSLPQLVLFRFLQGFLGAPIMPLSQTVMLDLYPRERHGQAMALWGMGTVLGPVAGPVLGGLLTDALSWRWIFFINLPIGLLAAAGVLLLLKDGPEGPRRPFQFLGFSGVAVFIGAGQLMLDRGPGQGWLASGEIRTYLACAVAGLMVLIWNTLKARDPFFDRRLLADRNFVSATVLGFLVAILILSTVALLPAMMQSAMGRSALDAGTLMAPRGFGVLAAMFVTGRLVGRFDHRAVLLLGLFLTGFATWLMAGFDVAEGAASIMISGFVHGLGLGVIFVPMNAVAFATISNELRAEAATLNTILRNAGGSVGISVMHALLVVNARHAQAPLGGGSPGVAGLPGLAGGAHDALTRQALMTAYAKDFQLMIGVVVCGAALLLLMRPKAAPASAGAPERR